ncbi:MAG: DNA starvation/stationary phase protection protein Dps [Chloroflexota bacterium]
MATQAVQTQTSLLALRSLPGVSADLRDKLVTDLNQGVAILTDLAIGYKQAHWNLVGRDFIQLHELTDRLAGEAHTHTDTIAERALALGGTVDGTLQAAAEQSPLPAISRTERDATRLIEQLLQRLDAGVEALRRSMDAAAEEPNTQDVYVEILRALEKDRWMLQAHLS